MTAFVIVIFIQSLLFSISWKADTAINTGFKIWFILLTAWSVFNLVSII